MTGSERPDPSTAPTGYDQEIRSHSTSLGARGGKRRGLVAVLGALAALILLAGCSGASSDGADADASESPVDGGTLTIGAGGRGAAETHDPNRWSSQAELERANLVYEPLVTIDPDGNVAPMLATTLEPNAKGTVWTANLRQDVTWHDGSPFTADDVLYTFQLLADPKGPYGLPATANIDFDATEAVDDHTISFVLNRPVATFDRSIAGMMMVQDGVDTFDSPTGTGPYVFESGSAGNEASYTRYPNYWGESHLENVKVVSIDDAQARTNALTSGQVDVVDDVPFLQAKTMTSDPSVNVVQILGASSAPFYMRVDQPPFDDPKVREAFRLAIDRQKCVDNALFGFGDVGNDLLTPGDYAYNGDLPQREYDPEGAKQLLAEAGYPSGITVSLTTASTFTGMMECSTIFAESAKAAGITIKLNKVPDADLFNPEAGFLSFDFGATWWPSSIENFIESTLLCDSPYNETHHCDPAFDEAYADAVAIVDPDARVAALKAIQKEMWEDGGYIIWGEQPLINATASNVHGYEPYNPGISGPVDIRTVWVS